MEPIDRMEQLRRALGGPLPGEAPKQAFWPARLGRRPDRRPRSAALEAAVLLLLHPKEGSLGLPLMLRREVEGDVHGGQISLPGGRREGDETPEACALREAREELGVDSGAVEILGRLSPHWIPVSGYLVQPVVAWCDHRPRLVPDGIEAVKLVDVSVEELESPHRRGSFERTVAGTTRQIPCWHLEEGELWGATAMILAELLELLSPSAVPSLSWRPGPGPARPAR